MNASRASLLCLLLAACSSDNGGGNVVGAGGYASVVATGGAAVGGQPVGANGGVPANGGAGTQVTGMGGVVQGAGGAIITPGSGGVGATPGAGGVTVGAGGTQPGAGGLGGTPGTAGATATGGAGGAGGGGGAMTGSAKGCDATTLLASSADPSVRGAWPVGEKTITLARADNTSFPVEVMYPAQVGSDAGKTAMKYDARSFLPQSERTKVPDAEATFMQANTFADLPLDASHGPYPLIVMVHGTGSFRVGSWSTQATWASRGFIVVAADHPNLFLGDYVKTVGAGACTGIAPGLNLSADVDAELGAVKGASGDWAFLSGHVDTTRIGLVGHSAGAYNVAQFTNKPGVQVVIPLAGTHSVNASSSLKSVAFIGGMSDNVLGYSTSGHLGELLYPGTQVAAYMGSPGSPVKKRLLGVTGGGHLLPTDLCPDKGQMSTLAIAQAHGVCGVSALVPLFDCGTADKQQGLKAVDDLSTAVFEETLQCQDLATVISATKTRNSVVGDFQESK